MQKVFIEDLFLRQLGKFNCKFIDNRHTYLLG
jgi:hypothetical protein